jgi:hypothetical protein
MGMAVADTMIAAMKATVILDPRVIIGGKIIEIIGATSASIQPIAAPLKYLEFYPV